MQLLSERTVLVTGAARGIGRAVAEQMASHGARVILTDIKAPATDGLERARGLALDVTDGKATEELFDALDAEDWLPDVVIPNAGILYLAPVTETDEARFADVINVNLTGAFLTARAAARRMSENGRIIFTSSLFGVISGAGNTAYSASKFGVVGMTKSMAADLAPRSILVNAVAPGQIMTEMMEELVKTRLAAGQADPRERLVARIPMGRMGSVEELAGTYVWLASDLSRYVTGQTIIVDGGWTVG
ncbi:MAG: SDR family NAD(P)-dependent oxidoreductase [Rhizobiaceae bacterium]